MTTTVTIERESLKYHMITPHFSVYEIINSAGAVRIGNQNYPPPDIMAVIAKTAHNMEKVRAALGNRPLVITSWYRSPVVNAAVRSSKTSQHVKGEAVDFRCPSFGSALDICRRLIDLKDLIRFDQLILEPSWVHISFAIATGKPRGQVLTLLATGDYALGLTTARGELL